MAYQRHSRHYSKRAANKEAKYLNHQGYSTKIEKEGTNWIVYKQRGKYATH